MIFELLAIYLSILLGCVLSTTCLILLGKSWGPLARCYLRTVAWIQTFYPDVYPKSHVSWPAIIAKFAFLISPRHHMDIAVDAIQSGIEAIVQDSLSTSFQLAPSYEETLLRSSALPQWSNSQKFIFYSTLIFRWGFLFPIRLSLLLLSFLYLIVVGVVALSKKLSDVEKTWIGIIYSRLYCSAIGLIVVYNNRHHRPKGAGVAVSNHMTPNDVHALYAGTPTGSSHGFVITGQKHSGIVGWIEAQADRVCPAIWVERKSASGRRKFLDEIIEQSKGKCGVPILLFPEGYCSNNTQVLQFRKAIFKEGITIYPIAIKQDSRFGDSFWSDETFLMYLLRQMSSWAIPYNVTYLSPMTHRYNETDEEFAARVQETICDALGVPAARLNGYIWHSKSAQRQILELQRKMCAEALASHKWPERSESDEGYYSVGTGCSEVLSLNFK